MSDENILIIEDDTVIQNFLKLALKTNQYKTEETASGLTGISLMLSNNPDLILLDLGLPDIDGMEVLKQIRQTSTMPIIIISARGHEKEKITALDAGADDYVTKPFSIDELLARIRVSLRRKKATPNTKNFVLEDLKIDYEKRRVSIKSTEIHLTPIEYRILILLTENAGKVLTHKFIQAQVWGFSTNDDYQTLRVFMASIRRKIETDTANPRYIETEVGVGYRFADE